MNLQCDVITFLSKKIFKQQGILEEMNRFESPWNDENKIQ